MNNDYEFPDNIPENFCVLPFVSLEARTNGDISPCCIMQDSAPSNLANGDSMIDVWKGEWLNSYREQFRNNQKPEACKNCWMEEQSGIASKRLRELNYYKHTYNWDTLNPTLYPMTLDVKLGNICNTKCRICTSFASSQWATEEIAQDPTRKETALEFNRKGLWPRKNELFWTELSDMLPSITKFEFFGGEPLLIDQHYKILEECVEKDLAKNIDVCYNTNGSIYPAEYIELYKNFKSVHFFFSIDAIGPQFDYIRHPNKFDDVLSNLQQFFKLVEENENIGCSVFQTIGILNMANLEELTDFFNTYMPTDIHYNMVFEPKHMSPKVLPPRAKRLITKKYANSPEYVQRIVNFMNSEDYHSDWFKFFVKTTQFSDNYRNENFVATFPELHELIRHEWNV